jgi:hypothetical protein
VGTTFDVRLPRWVEDTGEESEEKRHVKALVSGLTMSRIFFAPWLHVSKLKITK